MIGNKIKILSFSILAGIVGIVLVSCFIVYAALTDNIAGYWKLDESSGTAADSVASNTLTNNNTVTYSAGKINNAANFGTPNPNRDLTSTTNSGTIHQNMSFSIWVNITTAPGVGTSGTLFSVRTNTSGNYIDWNVYYENVGGTMKLTFHRNKPGVADQTVAYNIDLGTGTWYHIVMTYDTATLLGYVNGTQQASVSASGVGSGGATTIGIGTSLQGLLDEFGIWTKVLTTDEITSLYNAGAGLQYPFSTASATPAPDDNLIIFD